MMPREVMKGLRETKEIVEESPVWALLGHGSMCDDCFESTLDHYEALEFNLDSEVMEEEIQEVLRERGWDEEL